MARKKVNKDIPVVEEILTSTNIPAVIHGGALPIPTPLKEFKYEKLSASMMKTFLLCPRKFYMRYVKGLKEPPNTSFSLGTATHHALEQANKSLKENPRQLNVFEVKDYVQNFRDKLAELQVTSMESFSLGEEMVTQELNTYDLHERVIGIEQVFNLVTEEGVPIYGFMDKITEIDKNTIKITDYKTSVSPMSFEESKTDVQLSMYDLAVSMLYPQYSRRILELKYLRTGDPITVYRSTVEQENFRRQLLAVHRAILKFMEAVKDAPPGAINQFCTWCAYKQLCPEHIACLHTKLPGAPSTLELTDQQFIEQYEHVSAIVKAAEEYKEALKIWATGRINETPDQIITDGKKEVYTLSATRREYDIVGVGKLLGLEELLGKTTRSPLIKVSNKELEHFLRTKNSRKLEEQVEQFVTVKYNSPQIRFKKVS